MNKKSNEKWLKMIKIGATSASTPREVAEQADVIVTMLPASAHVKEVYSGKDGILGYVYHSLCCRLWELIMWLEINNLNVGQ